MELIEKLGIDWKLLVAQIINFSILLFLLAKFVYRPVLNVLDKRSKMIEQGIEDAKKSGEKLQEIEKLQDEKLAKAHREVGSILDEARKDAESMKKGIVEAAQVQAEDLLKRARLQMNEEKQKMIDQAREEMARLVVMATAKILHKEFSSEDQKRLLGALSNEMKSVK